MFMLRCPYCNFLSNPKTGDIYDSRFPCPKCDKPPKTAGVNPRDFKAVNCSVKGRKKGLEGYFGGESQTSKLLLLLEIASYGGSFYYIYNKLNTIETAESSSARKLKNMLGELLPALKLSSYLIPALALPEVSELVTSKEHAIIGLIYKVGVAYAMLKLVSHPFNKQLPKPII